jgi:stage II sporulation protein R
MTRRIMSGWLVLCLGLSMILTGSIAYREAGAARPQPESAIPAEELIRIHIIANSDSEADQWLKLQVRDAILAALAPRMAPIRSLTDAEATLQASLTELEEIAASVIAQHGSPHPVRVEFGRFTFPGKSYGDLYLPAGEYRALRLVIGRGEGANFWCLVYPSLCYNVREVRRYPTQILTFCDAWQLEQAFDIALVKESRWKEGSPWR